MNKNIFSKIALMAGVALMGISCQTDYFNETYLPGYENGGAITDAKNFELVLSADDYAAIAKNNAIGLGNKLIYWLPNDLKRFKALTTGRLFISTWEYGPSRPLMRTCGKPQFWQLFSTRMPDW